MGRLAKYTVNTPEPTISADGSVLCYGVKMYHRTATAGAVTLYVRESYNHSTRCTREYMVTGAGPAPMHFYDRPTPAGLRARGYAVPDGTPDRWSIHKEGGAM